MRPAIKVRLAAANKFAKTGAVQSKLQTMVCSSVSLMQAGQLAFVLTSTDVAAAICIAIRVPVTPCTTDPPKRASERQIVKIRTQLRMLRDKPFGRRLSTWDFGRAITFMFVPRDSNARQSVK